MARQSRPSNYVDVSFVCRWRRRRPLWGRPQRRRLRPICLLRRRCVCPQTGRRRAPPTGAAVRGQQRAAGRVGGPKTTRAKLISLARLPVRLSASVCELVRVCPQSGGSFGPVWALFRRRRPPPRALRQRQISATALCGWPPKAQVPVARCPIIVGSFGTRPIGRARRSRRAFRHCNEQTHTNSHTYTRTDGHGHRLDSNSDTDMDTESRADTNLHSSAQPKPTAPSPPTLALPETPKTIKRKRRSIARSIGP